MMTTQAQSNQDGVDRVMVLGWVVSYKLISYVWGTIQDVEVSLYLCHKSSFIVSTK
jgi:hypothetical protein